MNDGGWMASGDDRFWAKVDRRGSDECWPWLAGKERGYGFIQVQIDGKPFRMRAHRMSFELANGPIAEGLVVDHTCHMPACVNPGHLRAVTQQQNSANRAGPNSNSVSGVRGVSWTKQQRWLVTVGHAGKRHYGGTFVNLDEAARAAEALREKTKGL